MQQTDSVSKTICSIFSPLSFKITQGKVTVKKRKFHLHLSDECAIIQVDMRKALTGLSFSGNVFQRERVGVTAYTR